MSCNIRHMIQMKIRLLWEVVSPHPYPFQSWKMKQNTCEIYYSNDPSLRIYYQIIISVINLRINFYFLR